MDSDASSLRKTETDRRRKESTSSTSDEVDLEKDEEVDLEKDEEVYLEKDEEVDNAREGTTIQEIRGGIPDERDIEAQSPPLHKKESSRSVQDPNLVSIH